MSACGKLLQVRKTEKFRKLWEGPINHWLRRFLYDIMCDNLAKLGTIYVDKREKKTQIGHKTRSK